MRIDDVIAAMRRDPALREAIIKHVSTVLHKRLARQAATARKRIPPKLRRLIAVNAAHARWGNDRTIVRRRIARAAAKRTL